LEECVQEDGADGKTFASLAVTITVTDLHQEKVTERILLQKRYHITEPLTTRNPEGFARAMSSAATRFSAALRNDLTQLRVR
ncbi:MAG: hypothetical protein N2Z74_04465, partial [Syntrophales bacterium]|nr:hypothetical protein [Syntrophales bacterium]